MKKVTSGKIQNMVGLSGNNLSVINSEKDIIYQLPALDTESNVEEFNNNLIRYINSIDNPDLNILISNVVAQNLQGFLNNEIHIAIKEAIFNAKLRELFGEEIINNFEFQMDIKCIGNEEYLHRIYEQDGYYVFDYNDANIIDTGLNYKDKKVENDTIRYEYFYNPEFMVNYYKKMMTLEELMKKDSEYFFIKEIPVVSITYTKKDGLYRITSIEGIRKIYEVKLLLYENYEVSI